MSRLRPRLLKLAVIVAIVLPGGLAGAQTAPTPGPQPQPAPDIASLLTSNDARQQAWGAWYVGAGRLRPLAPLLESVIRQRLGAAFPEVAAADIALDALIQMQLPLPPDLLDAVYSARPAQALIAASFEGQDSDHFLRQILRSGSGLDWFAAANVLVSRRTRGLAGEFLAPLRLRVKIYLVDEGHMMGGGDGGGVGMGCGPGGLAPGMPPWPSYTLTSFADPGVTVLAAGPTSVYYRRQVSSAGESPAGSLLVIGGPTGDDRLKYLATLAEIDLEHLPLRGHEQHSVAARDQRTLDAEMNRIRDDLASRYTRFLMMLLHRETIRAEDVLLYPPQIEFTIEDHRSVRTPLAADSPAAPSTGIARNDSPASADSRGRSVPAPPPAPEPPLLGRSRGPSASFRRRLRWRRRRCAASTLRATRRRTIRAHASRSIFPRA